MFKGLQIQLPLPKAYTVLDKFFPLAISRGDWSLLFLPLSW